MIRRPSAPRLPSAAEYFSGSAGASAASAAAGADVHPDDIRMWQAAMPPPMPILSWLTVTWQMLVVNYLPAILTSVPGIFSVFRDYVGLDQEQWRHATIPQRRALWRALDVPEGAEWPRADLALAMQRRQEPLLTTGETRFPQLDLYLDEAEGRIDVSLRRNRTIFHFGGGINLRRLNWSVSMPQVHETAGRFPDDRVILVDRSAAARDAVPLSEYDFEAAETILRYLPNVGGNSMIAQRLRQILRRVPARLGSNIEVVIATFEDLNIAPNSADYIIATFSLCYPLQVLFASGGQDATLEFMAKFFKALKIRGVLFLEEAALTHFIATSVVANWRGDVTFREAGGRYRVFRLPRLTQRTHGNSPYVYFDADYPYVSTSDVFGIERIE